MRPKGSREVTLQPPKFSVPQPLSECPWAFWVLHSSDLFLQTSELTLTYFPLLMPEGPSLRLSMKASKSLEIKAVSGG